MATAIAIGQKPLHVLKVPHFPPRIFIGGFLNFREQITKRRGSEVSPCSLQHNLKGR